MKAFFQKNWIHFVAIIGMYIATLIFCKPVTEGYQVKQHDIQQFQGMSHEVVEFRKLYDEEPLWTSSMFGGMPLMQISVKYSGNIINTIKIMYIQALGRPIDIIFMHMLGFYIFALLLGMNPVVGVLGAIAMAFASYEIIIIQAGHNAKAMASAFLAPVLGAFIRIYRDKLKLWLLALAGVFMAFEIACNHVQVTYYLAILLIGLGFFYFFKALKEKTLILFFKKTVGLIGVFVLAGIINSPNLLLTSDYAKHTTRGGNDVTINPNGTIVQKQSSGLDVDYITQWSYGIDETFTLISPNIKGGGSFGFMGSQFEDNLLNSDLSPEQQEAVASNGVYWGDQPFTSGPVYIGIVVFILALLGLFFWNNRVKWVFLAVSVLAIALSWGNNFMFLTEFFVDYVPAYNMFRSVTIILILVELCAIALAMFFLHYLFNNRELFIEQKKKLAFILGGVVLFSIIMGLMGNTVDDFTSDAEQQQLSQIEGSIYQQIMSQDPTVLLANYRLDVNNKQQVKQFVDAQVQRIKSSQADLKLVRQDIYQSSWMRTASFAFFTGLIIFLFVSTSLSSSLLGLALVFLTAIDVMPVAYDYLGAQTDLNGDYKYWMDGGLKKFPVSANEADRQIMAMEVQANPELGQLISKSEQVANQEALDLDLTGQARQNAIDASTFSTLNFNTNYRVFDQMGGFNSSRSSYFHKAIGGYHGAKLRNFQNVVDFHIANGNNAVFDILNTKYFIQNTSSGPTARLNPNAAGNAWLVKRVRTFETPNDEIRALGTIFSIQNKGAGEFLVNGKTVEQAQVYGNEKLQYHIQGMQDTLTIPLSNGMKEGMEVYFVMDANQKTDLVMPSVFDTEEGKDSFLKLAQIQVKQTFDYKNEAVMLASEAKKLSGKTYSGKGEVKLTSYLPNKLTYTANLEGKQLVVFSEIFYDEGWKLFVDGKEVTILKVDYLLRGAEIPSGKHQLVMTFDLPLFHTLNTIAFIASMALILLLLGGLFLEYQTTNKK